MVRPMKVLAAWAMLGIATISSAADVPSVSVRLEPPVTPLQEPAILTIEVEGSRDTLVLWPGLEEHLEEAIGVFGEPDRRLVSLPNGRVRITTAYTLDPLRNGEYPIGPMRFEWGAEGASMVLAGPVLIVREPTEEERAALEHMEPDAATPMPPRQLGWQVYVLGLIAAALLGGLIGWWWRTRDKEDFYAPAALAPWEKATEALRALREKKLAEQGEHEPYFVELSAILRTYIEARFHLHAPEMTTPEFLQSATESGLLSAEQQVFLERFLKQSDRVKFAKLAPSFEDMKTSMAEVTDFVEETIPRELEQPGPEEAAA